MFSVLDIWYWIASWYAVSWTVSPTEHYLGVCVCLRPPVLAPDHFGLPMSVVLVQLMLRHPCCCETMGVDADVTK